MAHIGFTDEAIRAFKDNNRPGPIHMLNLIKLKDQATYEDGRKATGRDAYTAYSDGTLPILEKLGARIAWRGKMEQMLIGPEDMHWDICFIVEYPSVDAFMALMRDADYRKIAEHRQAAVADSRLVRMAPLSTGQNLAK